MCRNLDGLEPIVFSQGVFTEGYRAIQASDGKDHPVFLRRKGKTANVRCCLVAVDALPLLGLDLTPETYHAIEPSSRKYSEGRVRPSKPADCAIMSFTSGDVYLRCTKTGFYIDELNWISLPVCRCYDYYACVVASGYHVPKLIHLYVDLAKKSEFGEKPTIEPYKHVSTVAMVKEG